MGARITNANRRKFLKFALKHKPTDPSNLVAIITGEVDEIKASSVEGPYWDERLAFYSKMQLYFAETANFTRYTKTLEFSQSGEVLAKQVYAQKAVYRGMNPMRLAPMIAAHSSDFTATEDLITNMQETEDLPETHLGALPYKSEIQRPLQTLEDAVALMQERVDKVQSPIEMQEMMKTAKESVIALRQRYPVCTDETASGNAYNNSTCLEFKFALPHPNRPSLVAHWRLLSQQ